MIEEKVTIVIKRGQSSKNNDMLLYGESGSYIQTNLNITDTPFGIDKSKATNHAKLTTRRFPDPFGRSDILLTPDLFAALY
jgi:hypothetical protein